MIQKQLQQKLYRNDRRFRKFQLPFDAQFWKQNFQADFVI